MKKYGKVVPMWCSESGGVGWTFFTDLDETDIRELLPKSFRSPPDYRFSCNNLVYNYVTLLANGVERWFYYSFASMGGANAEQHGYMLEYNGAPKPHALAYAALADRLTGKPFKASVDKGHYVKMYVFSGESGHTAVVFGRYLGGRTLQLTLPQGRKAFTTFNVMGNPVRFPVQDGKLAVPLTEEPIYVEAPAGRSGLKALAACLEGATVRGLEGFEDEWRVKTAEEEDGK
jgi:hypothetical protein